ncbi:glycosyltransferase [Mycobacterium sp. GA-2829]|uniref:glycosyltransferase n=1 Tax=Mycobacterium sp. GA-2829 TaxID=1772283 RepID=UPI00073FE199|nr:glycosyltransferase [Mycobacterium sp. GA-2829]KUI37057.1 glycosyl transferase family 1 [Mycobacterium sp. GA-2829]
MRVALIASARYPVCQPFAGGLEAFVYQFANALAAAGHSVTMFAAPGSAVDLPWDVLPVHTLQMTEASREDPSVADWVVHETHAYLSVMMDLAGPLADSFDVVHNNSLHYLPLAMARTLPMPMLTTLHTPPLKWLEQAVALPGGVAGAFTAVSAFTARQWEPVNGPVPVIANGIDLDDWKPGPGGDYAVWSGRLVPEKGLPDAIAAARLAGYPLRIAGPVGEQTYFDEAIRPELGDGVTYEGHLRRHELNELVGGAAVALVTPRWEEPYGLVTAEALASGTPVAAVARGGIPETIDTASGRLAPPGDIPALARALEEAAHLPRGPVRARAESHCSQTVMVARYLARYAELIGVDEEERVSA